jgi:uncharacterized protein YecE (DUF72 family)
MELPNKSEQDRLISEFMQMVRNQNLSRSIWLSQFVEAFTHENMDLLPEFLRKLAEIEKAEQLAVKFLKSYK